MDRVVPDSRRVGVNGKRDVDVGAESVLKGGLELAGASSAWRVEGMLTQVY